MKSQGNLVVCLHADLDRPDRPDRVDWTWTPRGRGSYCRTKKIDPHSDQLADAIGAYQDVCEEARHIRAAGGVARGIRKKLEAAQAKLKAALVPSDFDLTALPRGLICVNLRPQTIPLEALMVGREPFGVHNILLHQRLESGIRDSSRAPEAPLAAMHEHCARLAVVKDSPLEPDRHREHCAIVGRYITDLYGKDCTDHDELRVLTDSKLITHLRQDDLGLFYYFGHGKDGALTPDKGSLNGEGLAAIYQDARPRNAGLAFLNACWSSSDCHPGERDITSVLLGSGWQAVIGMFGAAVSQQAVRFAEIFLRALSHRGRGHIFRAFRTAVRLSWRGYNAESDKNGLR